MDDRIVTVRIPAADFALVRGVALGEGKKLSEFIRQAAVERALEPRQSEAKQ